MNKQRFDYLRHNFHMPDDHKQYLISRNIQPKVIYDIGACTLHWYDMARTIWPQSHIICFDAIYRISECYRAEGIQHYEGLLSDKDSDVRQFWSNPEHPAGNSAYRENPMLSPQAWELYKEEYRAARSTLTLDSARRKCQFALPDLIKLDVQGSELDILKGAQECLDHAQWIVAEVQSESYNLGAPFERHVHEYLESQGFDLIIPRFSGSPVQGDAFYARTVS